MPTDDVICRILQAWRGSQRPLTAHVSVDSGNFLCSFCVRYSRAYRRAQQVFCEFGQNLFDIPFMFEESFYFTTPEWWKIRVKVCKYTYDDQSAFRVEVHNYHNMLEGMDRSHNDKLRQYDDGRVEIETDTWIAQPKNTQPQQTTAEANKNLYSEDEEDNEPAVDEAQLKLLAQWAKCGRRIKY